MLPPEEWDRQSTAIGSIPIGQGVAVTALQMLQAFNVLGSDGTYVPARLVRAITGPDGESQTVPSGEPRRVVSPETAAAVRAMMAQVVSRGTGQMAAIPGYSIAGKTGTAERGEFVEDQSWYAALAPYPDPDVVVVATIERGGFGADAAAPAVQQMLTNYFDVKPEKIRDVSSTGSIYE